MTVSQNVRSAIIATICGLSLTACIKIETQKTILKPASEAEPALRNEVDVSVVRDKVLPLATSATFHLMEGKPDGYESAIEELATEVSPKLWKELAAQKYVPEDLTKIDSIVSQMKSDEQMTLMSSYAPSVIEDPKNGLVKTRAHGWVELNSKTKHRKFDYDFEYTIAMKDDGEAVIVGLKDNGHLLESTGDEATFPRLVGVKGANTPVPRYERPDPAFEKYNKPDENRNPRFTIKIKTGSK